MKKNHGKYLVAAAVFSLVVTFTSAAGAIGDTCNNDGECTVVGTICSTTCGCGGSYKVDPGNGAQCIKKGLGDTCAIDADCSVGVTNSKCSTGTTKICECITDYTPINSVCQKGLGDSCTAAGDCSAVTGATCGTSNMCACGGSYKPDTADTTKCKLKGLGDTCAIDADCSVGVTNSKCSTGTTKICECITDYTPINSVCQKGLGDSCTAAGDCSAVTGATCVSNACACGGSYKPDTADTTKCKLKGLADSCTAPVDCSAVTGATCVSNICACGGSYKPDTADNTKCKLKGLGDTCAIDADCSAGVTNSKCSTGTPTICECIPNYTEIDSLCKKGLNNTCNSDPDCSAVDNAECDGTSKRCVCKITYKEDNGKCSSANGLQTPLSATVAFLMSLLTIVFTRLP